MRCLFYKHETKHEHGQTRSGFPQVTSDAISWPFPDFFLTNVQFLLTFCSINTWYFDLLRNSHRSHKWKKNIVAIISHKLIMICHFYVPYQPNCGLIYKMSKNYRRRFSYISFWRLRDWATPSEEFEISLVRSSETSKNDSRTSGIPAGLIRRTTAYFWFSHKLHWLCMFQTRKWYIRANDFYNPLAQWTRALNLKFWNLPTETVKIWNEAFILISIPFFLTFSWLFGEFQNFLTHMKIYWLFPEFLRFSLFPDFLLTREGTFKSLAYGRCDCEFKCIMFSSAHLELSSNNVQATLPWWHWSFGTNLASYQNRKTTNL